MANWAITVPHLLLSYLIKLDDTWACNGQGICYTWPIDRTSTLPVNLTPLHICIARNGRVQELHKLERENFIWWLNTQIFGLWRLWKCLRLFLIALWMKLRRIRGRHPCTCLWTPAYICMLTHLQRRCWHCRPGCKWHNLCHLDWPWQRRWTG